MIQVIWRKHQAGSAKVPVTFLIYMTNAIESVNYTIRKAVNNRRFFPNDDAALKLICMSLQRISKNWTMPLKDWETALSQFAVIYGERFPL
jgi:transposase-like protein